MSGYNEKGLEIMAEIAHKRNRERLEELNRRIKAADNAPLKGSTDFSKRENPAWNNRGKNQPSIHLLKNHD